MCEYTDYKIGLEIYVKQHLLDALVLYQMCNKSLLIMGISAVGIATLITVFTVCYGFIAELFDSWSNVSEEWCFNIEVLENTIDWSRFKNIERKGVFDKYLEPFFMKKIWIDFYEENLKRFLSKKLDEIFSSLFDLWKLVQKWAISNNFLTFIR